MEPVKPLFEKYCYGCHNPDKKKGKLDLTPFTTREAILQEPKLWEEVLLLIEEEEMPPKGEMPTGAERVKMAHWVDQTIHELDWSKHKNPGHVTIPRLTRAEYNHTMRDLLGIDLQPGLLFGEDGQGASGFTNDRDALYVTPVILEKYLTAADRALTALFALDDKPTTVHLESEKMFMTETSMRPETFGDGFVGYALNRGQMTLYESVVFPQDGYYEFKLRARATTELSGTRLRINDVMVGDIVLEGSQPNLYTLRAFVPRGSHQMAWNIQKPLPPDDPNADIKPYHPDDRRTFPAQMKSDGRRNAPKIPREFIALGIETSLYKDAQTASEAMQEAFEWLRAYGPDGSKKDIARYRSNTEKHRKTLTQKLGEMAEALGTPVADLQATFDYQNADRLADNQKLLNAVAHVKDGVKIGNAHIDWIEVTGPLTPEGSIGAKRVLIAEPSDSLTPRRAASKVLRRFLPRAFRRPIEKGEAGRYLALFDKAQKRGDGFRDSMRLALTGVLASPHFLFRSELGPDLAEAELNDYQLASRLSYFLWMTMPDDELFELAAAGKLRDETVLRRQVRRMLKDPKSRVFIETFAGQWLDFETLGRSVMPDPDRFPQFTVELNDAMKLEVVMTLEHMLREGGNLLGLIDSDHTYVNQLLARHYKISGVSGPEMRRVKLDTPNRGGLLGTGAVLTATSSPTRTSPVLRGQWVLETLLGLSAGEPPAEVPPLPENAGRKKGLTLRQEFEQHRENPTCASCHDKIDPIGFGLENFDAIGRFRTKENGVAIDASGTLDGASFNGPAELKAYILDHHADDFIRNVTERMLGFALGRRLRYYDAPVIEGITRALADNDYSAATLVEAVVLSYPFGRQNNRSEIDFRKQVSEAGTSPTTASSLNPEPGE
ncbi:MAG: DUF1592 domain-containing protein [Planctomycetota bacterium]|jgi:hypothetical protein